MATHTMSVTVELTESEEERLAHALRVDPKKLQQTLQQLAKGSTEEWLDQVLARRLPPRIKDVREVRLLHYSLHVNSGQLPRPEQIADLFHLTAPEARTLHRNTRTRYSFELAKGVDEALGTALDGAAWIETSDIGGYVRVHMDDALFEYAELQLSWGTEEPAARITKDENYEDYRVPLSSFEILCTQTGKDPKARLAAMKKSK